MGPGWCVGVSERGRRGWGGEGGGGGLRGGEAGRLDGKGPGRRVRDGTGTRKGDARSAIGEKCRPSDFRYQSLGTGVQQRSNARFADPAVTRGIMATDATHVSTQRYEQQATHWAGGHLHMTNPGAYKRQRHEHGRWPHDYYMGNAAMH